MPDPIDIIEIALVEPDAIVVVVGNYEPVIQGIAISDTVEPEPE
jgi:hypothetical protein